VGKVGERGRKRKKENMISRLRETAPPAVHFPSVSNMGGKKRHGRPAERGRRKKK